MTKLNPFVLVVIDNQLNPDKYTQEQLEDNAAAANNAATYAADVDYWLDKYFTRTGEDKQDYINELENKND